nr:hypothetical protein [Allgaiera sp.]
MDVGEPVGPTLMQRLSNNSVAILRWLLGLAVVALALIFGVRPVLAKLIELPAPGQDRPDAEDQRQRHNR